MITLASKPSSILKTKQNKLDDNDLICKEYSALVIKKLTPTSQLQKQQQTQELPIASNTAFQVLNQDYLGQITKPNAIVHPSVRRPAESNIAAKLEFDASSLPINDKNSKKNSNIFNFAKELDFKLKRLKKDNLPSSRNNSTQESLSNRPLFITTVPRGVFIQPVKEPQIPSRRVYAFSSRPRIFTINNENVDMKAIDNGQDDRIGKGITSTVNEIRTFTQHFLNSSLSSSKKISRDSQASKLHKNIMHDKRIVRGSNYSQTQFAAGDAESSAMESERRRHLIKKRQVQIKNLRNVIGTPPPVYGRKHEDIQTDTYLEEIYEKPPVHEACAQTDLFLIRPPTPPYIANKTGVDMATEILEGELFDFDTEVQPIIDTLVGYTVQQSLIEVTHEEEISELKRQQQEFLAQREAELGELRRLEAEEIRLQAEKHKRLRQDEISKQLDAEVQEHVTAAKLLQGYISKILPEVLLNLEPLTEAADRTNLEKELCPWLTKEVAEEVGHIIDSKEILIEIIKEILVERANKYLDIPEEPIEEQENEPDEDEISRTPTQNTEEYRK